MAGSTSPRIMRIEHRNPSGQLHRLDGPALVIGGSSYWFQDGVPHRDGGPAVTHPDGVQLWFQHGFLHREDGPAEITQDGAEFWYRHGMRRSPKAMRRLLYALSRRSDLGDAPT